MQMRRYSKLAALGTVILGQTILASCTARPSSSNDLATVMSPAQADLIGKIAASKDQGASQHLARGVQWLKQSDYKKALEEFNLGLKRDPQHPLLNFFAAYCYQEMARGGDVDKLNLAEVGYQLALKFNPSMRAAAVQLGYIALDRRDWRGAQNDFSLALEINPNDRGAIYALAYASYYAGDLATAQAMIRRLPEDAQESPEILRTRAIIAAATGDNTAAGRYASAYAAAEPEPQRREQLAGRVDRWEQTLTWLGPKPAVPPVQTAQFDQGDPTPPGGSQYPQLSPAPTPQELAPIKPDVPLGSNAGQAAPDNEKMVIVDSYHHPARGGGFRFERHQPA